MNRKTKWTTAALAAVLLITPMTAQAKSENAEIGSRMTQASTREARGGASVAQRSEVRLSQQTGLVRNSSGLRYIDKTTKKAYVNRWRTVSGKTYFFGKDSYAVRGLQTINGVLHFFGDDFVQYKNRWRTVTGRTYYFNANGVPLKGLHKVNGVLHFFGNDGVQFKNRCITVSGRTYYFNANGTALKGLQRISGVLHFFTDAGVQVKNSEILVSSKAYDVNRNGVATLWQRQPLDHGSFQWELSEELWTLIQNYRKANGKAPLVKADRLTWNRAMLSATKLATNGFQHGYNYDNNIAAGYQTAQDAFQGWKNSPGHNANLLRDYGKTPIAIGWYYEAGTTYWHYTTFGQDLSSYR